MLDNRHPSPIANSLTSLREPTALACGRDLSNQRRAVRRGAASAGEVAPSPVPAPAPQDASSDRSGWQSQGFLYIRPDLEHRNRPAQSRAPPPHSGARCGRRAETAHRCCTPVFCGLRRPRVRVAARRTGPRRSSPGTSHTLGIKRSARRVSRSGRQLRIGWIAPAGRWRIETRSSNAVIFLAVSGKCCGRCVPSGRARW